MLRHTWRTLIDLPPRKRRPAPRSTPLAVETLEDRWVPSGLPAPIIDGPFTGTEGVPLVLNASPGPGTTVPVTFQWDITRTDVLGDTSFYLVDAGDVLTFPPEDGTYHVQLTASDGIDTASSFQDVVVANVPPTAQVDGANLYAVGSFVFVGSTVTDPVPLDSFSYSWALTRDGLPYNAPDQTLPDETYLGFTAVEAGAYQARLVVTDGGLATSEIAVKDFVVAANQPPTVALAGATTSIAENTPTATRIKVADVVVTDDGLGDNNIGLTGADASMFEVDGTALYLKAGTAIDFETNPVLDVTVGIDDPAVGATPDSQAPLSISVTDVNEAPTVALAGATTSIAENTPTATRIKVADIVVQDDALGDNNIGLTGADASMFEVDGTALYLKAGTAIDFETNPVLDVTVGIDDPAVGATPDSQASLSIAVTDVNEITTTVLVGSLYIDHNVNHARDPGDSPAAGRTVFLDANDNGIRDASERFATTDASGGYRLAGLLAGGNTLRVELMPAAFAISHVAGQNLVLVDGATTTAEEMGIRQQLTAVPLPVFDSVFHPQDPGDGSTDLVRSWYRSILGREADTAGLTGWANMARAGAVDQAFAGIWNSPEHRTNEVQSYYQTYLGRMTDAGAAEWVAFMLRGADESEVVAGILSSAEYANRTGDATGFVRSLYPMLLGRMGSDADVSAHVANLNAGMSRADLVRTFMATLEGASFEVKALYSCLLERASDPLSSGIRSLLMTGDLKLGEVAQALLRSEEFAIRATS